MLMATRPRFIISICVFQITPTSLRNFHDNFFQPSRIAVAAVNSNLPHESLLEILAPAFCAPEQFPVAATHTSGPMSRAQSRSLKAASYIGGESRLPSKGASHLHLVFQAGSFFMLMSEYSWMFCSPGCIHLNSSALSIRRVVMKTKNRVLAESRDICRSRSAVLHVGIPCELWQATKGCDALERCHAPLPTRAHSVL
jgi:hypothetical protein